MARWKAGCLILIIALAGAASADIYRWTDENGKLHFAQSLQQFGPVTVVSPDGEVKAEFDDKRPNVGATGAKRGPID